MKVLNYFGISIFWTPSLLTRGQTERYSIRLSEEVL